MENKMNFTISGGAGSEINHYDMDEAVVAKFGDKVEADSESGCFFCYTSEDMVAEVLEFVKEIGGENAGLTWKTYGGETGLASFHAFENV